MMTEISLNLLDIAENSARANATRIDLLVVVSRVDDTLLTEVTDNGYGMTQEELARVEDPFFTSRKTRKVGLGVPFFKQAALLSGGSFEITSKPGVGTKVKAVFGLSNIDRMPLGNMTETMLTLIKGHPEIDFTAVFRMDEREFVFSTEQVKEILGQDVSIAEPEVQIFLKEYLSERINEVWQKEMV